MRFFRKLVRTKAKRLFEKDLSKNINYIPRKSTTANISLRLRFELDIS